MFRSSRLSPADAGILREAADVADAQMWLVEQMKRQTGNSAKPLRHPGLFINLALMLAASALVAGSWT